MNRELRDLRAAFRKWDRALAKLNRPAAEGGCTGCYDQDCPAHQTEHERLAFVIMAARAVADVKP